MAPEINIKGIRDGLLVTVGDGEWSEVEEILLRQVQQQAEFLKGAQLTLDLGNHILHAAEMGSLRDALSDFGISLRAILSNSPTTEKTAQTLGLATRISRPHPDRLARPLDTTVKGGEEAILLKRTLRSGFRLEHPGHVTLIGDVNPGAEIIASGNIVVWGRLKGMVHAGAEGDTSACVFALQLAPTQLRIAGKIAIPPQSDDEIKPEIATLREGQVTVEPWDLRS